MDNYFSIISPILLIIGGIISWFLKTRKEELQIVEIKAREQRIIAYNKILKPYTLIFSSNENNDNISKAIEMASSSEYREASFNIMFYGSDDMVNSFNNLMQSLYKSKENEGSEIILSNFSKFILTMRKDLYKKKTKIKEGETIKFMIKDYDEYKKIFPHLFK